MYVRIVGESTGGGTRYSLRCPNCGHIGTFEPIHNHTDIHVNGHWLSLRRCPNPQCQAGVFVVTNDAQQVLRSYPALRVDFDPKNIPPKVLATISEAITCHAEKCFVAAGMMIRRCLEEVCEDRGATGPDLKARIHGLRSKVVLPDELFLAMDDLRLLGNDAAHVEAKAYDSIGQEEVETGIALAKEVLKALYQLDDLVARLRALKK